MDGCDDCLSGQFDPNNDGLDDDGDGIYNSADNCSNTAAIGYAGPENDVCRGECDTAPIYNGIEIVTLPTSQPVKMAWWSLTWMRAASPSSRPVI